MTVGQLRKLLHGTPDSVRLVLTDSSDGSFLELTPDNFRGSLDGSEREVIVIDLGSSRELSASEAHEEEHRSGQWVDLRVCQGIGCPFGDR